MTFLWHIRHFRYGFLSPGLSSRDTSVSVADDQMISDHFPIQYSLDKPLKRNTPHTEPNYRFDKTNDDLLHSFENILKTTVSLLSTSQALGDPSQQMTIFSISLSHHGKLQSRRTCNSCFPRCRKSIRQCLAQWTQVQNLPAWSAHQAL